MDEQMNFITIKSQKLSQGVQHRAHKCKTRPTGDQWSQTNITSTITPVSASKNEATWVSEKCMEGKLCFTLNYDSIHLYHPNK